MEERVAQGVGNEAKDPRPQAFVRTGPAAVI